MTEVCGGVRKGATEQDCFWILLPKSTGELCLFSARRISGLLTLSLGHQHI